MFSTLFTVALFIAPAIQGVFAGLAVNQPNLVQCQTARFSWPATKGPYDLVIVKASDPCGTPVADLGQTDKTFLDWKVAIPAGTKVQISLVDANDDEAWSGDITVAASSDTSCLGGGGASKPSTSTAPTPSTTPSTTDGTTNSGSTGGGDGSSSGNVVPIGAANAGTLSSGALSAYQANRPLLTIAGLVAAFALSL